MKDLLNQYPMLLHDYCKKELHSYIDFHLSVRKMKRNDTIFKEGLPVDHIKFIKKGKAKVVADADGREKIVRFASDGDIIGHRGIGSDWMYPVSCYALSNVELYLMPVETFKNLLKMDGELCYQLLIFMADELRNSEFDNRHSLQMTVQQRIARALLYFEKVFDIDKNDNNKLRHTPSRKEIASFVSTTYESVIRTLRVFEQDKIIAFTGKKIHLIDKSKLLEISETEDIAIARL